MAVATYADDYGWTMLETTTGYLNKMFKFTADSDGNPIEDDMGDVIQDTKSPIMFVHTATRDCLSWLTETKDDSVDSIPKLLFDQGHSVYLACRRGTAYSRAHETFDLDTDEGLESYFDYSTGSVGSEDIGRFVDLIIADRTDCTKVQIVTHGLGAAEVFSGLAAEASTLGDTVSHVTNLTPCLVNTAILKDLNLKRDDEDDDDSSSSTGHRLLRALEAKQTITEPPRELQEVVEEDMPKR